MNILVAIQFVPDLVEELIIAEDGKGLDLDSVRWTVSEFDDHAIEEAILLKEHWGGNVTVLAPEYTGVDDVLFQSAAKGADRLVKLSGDLEGRLNSHALARLVAQFVRAETRLPDLILTGVQAHNSLDGSLGPLLAASSGLPFVDCVAHTAVEDAYALVHKEYPGGLAAEIEVQLPAVLGIQAADSPPRYVPISKIRLAMKTSRIEEYAAGEIELRGEIEKTRMYLAEIGEQAEMLEGDVVQVADQMISLFQKLNVL